MRINHGLGGPAWTYMDSSQSQHRRDIVISMALLAATAAGFWPAVRCDFVNIDDGAYVTENVYVRAGLTLESLRWVLTHFHFGMWIPLTTLSHMADCQVYGLHAWGHHLTSLLLHLANTVLVYLVFQRMTGAVGRSAVVALLFGLHPLHVEPVAWIASRKDVLSTLFCLVTIRAYAWHAQQPSVGRFFGVTAVYALALLAKPSVMTLPLVLLLLDFWPLGRFKSGVARLVLEKVPLLVLALGSAAVTMIAERSLGSVTSLEIVPLSARVSNALVAYFSYILKTVWPARLAVFYPHPGSDVPLLLPLLAAVGLIATTIAALGQRATRPYLVVGWLWYLITLLPVIGLVQLGQYAMADRYSYVPLIGLFVVLAWGAPDLFEKMRHGKAALSVGTAAALAGLGALSWFQIGHWRNSETLFRHALRVTTNNAVAHLNLGGALVSQGRAGEAADHFAEAVRLAPNDSLAQNSLGVALAMQGAYETALPYFEQAVRLRPGYGNAHANLGNVLIQLGRESEGVREFRRALELLPGEDPTRSALERALADLGESLIP
ncbi:MAG: tetratricopeptide repeat protein [Candidatus Hydrogenedentes bacterium]|nr:tetratricopeptide repeat protein [Candidatus Hydrogenedentota bacterium]